MSADQLPARIDLLKAAFGDAAAKFEENLNEGALARLSSRGAFWRATAAMQGCDTC